MEDRSVSAGQSDPVMPIAIIGISGRYPGDAATPEKLWDMISTGRSAMTEIPVDRFNASSFHHPNQERGGCTNNRGAHFIAHTDKAAFDAPFFSITSAEAVSMDPQQRWALECSYEAIENAGLPMDTLVGSETSVFIGSFATDYRDTIIQDSEDLPAYFATGTGGSMLSNRISWFYDLRGPSLTLDTACSSSLVALHLGCQSLRAGESKMSIIGGVNFILGPGLFVSLASQGFLSSDSLCKSFDEKANGYSRGEGASFVVLKPLDQALEDGDMIRAIVRNTGINQDGNTPGITMPSAAAQEALIRKCYSEAGLSLSQTQFVECHGTGTQAGDPRETSALSKTFGLSRQMGDPLLIGSIKTNIGHLEGASGLAQVTKAVLALEKGEIPPNLWYEKPNARIPMQEWNVKVVDRLTPWPSAGLRRISVNSFGYGGTNAHCIIDDSYHYLKARNLQGNHATVCESENERWTSTPDSGLGMAPTTTPGATSKALMNVSLSTKIDYFSSENPISPPKLFIWSSNEQSGLERTASLYREYLTSKLSQCSNRKDEQQLLNRLARTLATRRTQLPWKNWAAATSGEELILSMQSPAVKGRRSGKAPRLGFVFTGQGAQWYAMGRELRAYPIFDQSLRDADAHLSSIGCPWSLVEEFSADEKTSQINAPQYSQPICTALQIAMVELFGSWGVTPSAVVGHSSGEIAAAYAQGALSREAAWTISYYRGDLSGRLTTISPGVRGGMLATGLSAELVQPYIDALSENDGCVSVACRNSPVSTTISGDFKAIKNLENILIADGHFARVLKVETAYHSEHMRVIAEPYLQSMDNIATLAPSGDILMFSSVTGNLIKSGDLGPAYWVANMVGEVNFVEAVQNLCRYSKGQRRTLRGNVDVLVEFGPHAALQGPLRQILKAEDKRISAIECLSVLSRGSNACGTALSTVGVLAQMGYAVDIPKVNGEVAGETENDFLVDIPPFSWNRTNKYWREPNTSLKHRLRKHPRTDILGVQLAHGTTLEPMFRNILKLSDLPWMEGHKVQGTILYPAAGMMAAAIEGAAQRASNDREVDGYELRDIIIGKALVIPADGTGVETMLSFRPWRAGSRDLATAWEEFRLMSRVVDSDTWDLNCSGLVNVRYATTNSAIFADEKEAAASDYRRQFDAVDTACKTNVDLMSFYQNNEDIGYTYSGPFRNLSSIRNAPYKSRCELTIPDTASLMPKEFEYPHIVHPSVLDGISQMMLPSTEDGGKRKAAVVPTSIENLFISAKIPSKTGEKLHGVAFEKGERHKDADSLIIVYDDKWDKPVFVCKNTKVTAFNQGAAGAQDQANNVRKIVAYFNWQEDISMMTADALTRRCRDTMRNESECSQEYAQLAAFIDLQAHKTPGMKILEVGAGNGQATQSVLRALGGENGDSPRMQSYAFTDTDSERFEAAQEEFKTWLPWMTFSELDIQQDPMQQSFKEAEYDLIIAPATVDATSNKDALNNAKKLLKEFGKLVIIESAAAGLTPETVWHQALQSSGFSGVDCVLRPATAAKDHISIIVSHVETVSKLVEVPENVLIIVPDVAEAELEDFIFKSATRLEQAGSSVVRKQLKETHNMDVSNVSCLFCVDCSTKPDSALLPSIGDANFVQLRRIITSSASSTWITRGATGKCEAPTNSLMTGLARSIRAENPGVALTTLDLEFNAPINTVQTIEKVLQVFYSSSFAENNARPDWEYAIRNNEILIQRILLEQGMNDLLSRSLIPPNATSAPFKQAGRPLALEVANAGRLDTLQFDDDKEYDKPLKDTDVEIEVRGVGLNFKDVMIAMGQLQKAHMGVECSGIISRVGAGVKSLKVGDRILTTTGGCYRTYARSTEAMCAIMPETMSFAIAASIPVVFSTAWYSLNYAARIRRGETVLIHAAAGGVGQAAVMICQHLGAEIFATVSSKEKKQIIMEKYNIPEDHIFNSRDDSFVSGVMRMTKQKGVDVVLNSLAGELLRKTWHCVSSFGRFIEIGLKDIESNTGLDMVPFRKNITFSSVNMVVVTEDAEQIASKVLKEVIAMFEEGSIRAVAPITVLPFSKMEDGFRTMQIGKHIGKIVFEYHEGDTVPVVPARCKPVNFSTNATYVLSGGLGGIGRSIAEWMYERGARNIVFFSRSGDSKPEAKATLKMLKSRGANVAALRCDITDAAALEEAVEECCKTFPPIKGCIQAAMVLQDAIYDNMTHEQYTGAVKPKVQGSWNLHHILPKDMDFFVMLSSVSGVIGAKGQGNYAAGNTFQDALAHYRHNQGLAAGSIDLGVILDVGYVAETVDKNVAYNLKHLLHAGVHEKEIHALIQASITGQSQNGKKLASPQLITGTSTGGMSAVAGGEPLWWHMDAKFSHICNVDLHKTTQNNSGSDTIQLASLLSQAANMKAAETIVLEALVFKIAKSLMVEPEDVETSKTVSKYGVDSLVAVEIRAWIFTEMQADISVFQLLSNVPLTELAATIASKSKAVPAALYSEA